MIASAMWAMRITAISLIRDILPFVFDNFLGHPLLATPKASFFAPRALDPIRSRSIGAHQPRCSKPSYPSIILRTLLLRAHVTDTGQLRQ